MLFNVAYSVRYNEVRSVLNTNKYTILRFMRITFYVAPTRFGAIISPSSGRWNQNLLKTYINKKGHNKVIIVTCFIGVF